MLVICNELLWVEAHWQWIWDIEPNGPFDAPAANPVAQMHNRT